MRRRAGIAILCLVLFGVLFVNAAKAAPSPAVVFTEKVKPGDLFNVLSFPARVESKVNAAVRTEADGIVAEIFKPLGSKVQRGDKIASIKHTDPVYEYAPLLVRAPVNGIVYLVSVTPGSLVNKGDIIASVTDPEQIRLAIEVEALDVHAIRQGLKGELLISGISHPLHATVQGISPAVDPMLGTASCELTIDKADRKLVVPGMVGKVEFKLNQHKGIVLADNAVLYRGDKTFVRVVENGVAKRIPVSLGEHKQGQVEILSGLHSGDVVIDRSSRYVGDGEPVQVDTAHE
jgi:multidrug efflux pump subunit AcrA (membrane-fusion protein)